MGKESKFKDNSFKWVYLLFLVLSIFLFLGCLFYMQILSDLPQYVWNGLNNIRFYGELEYPQEHTSSIQSLKRQRIRQTDFLSFRDLPSWWAFMYKYFTYYGPLVSLTFRKKERAVNKILFFLFYWLPL